jgi:hypothetical protein
MQLGARQAPRAALLTFVLALAGVGGARAQSSVDVASTVFYEKGGSLDMLVINPAVKARAQVADALALRAGWEADVVSGASVAVVDAPSGTAGGVDAITSATRLEDFRQLPSGGVSFGSDVAKLDATYSYGFEKDYRSHGLNVSASSDLFDRNTQLALSYGRGWDEVCDLLQPEARDAAERQRLPSSTGCFEKKKGRARRDLDVHSFEGTWTQAWTSIFNTQLVAGTQLLSGFQSNPYRAVWLGRAAAQEHHPRERARYALGLSARLWLKPIGGAVQLHGRVYRDTWDVRSVSGELGYERGLGDLFRIRVRGRYYRQTSAAFYSDDYGLDPRGAYFTGDRELSGMSSWLAGLRLEFTPSPGEDGRVVGFMDSFKLVLKGDFLKYEFPDFHYGNLPVPNNKAVFGTLAIEGIF